MSKRMKYYLIALFMMLALAGAVVVFFARAQSAAQARRARFDAEHAEPVRRAEVLLRETLAQPPDHPRAAPGTQAPEPLSARAKPERKRVNILYEISMLNAGGTYDEYRLKMETGSSFRVPLPSNGKITNPEALPPADLKLLQDLCRSMSFHYNESHLLVTQDRKYWDEVTQVNANMILGDALTQRLDRLDALLLDCDWTAPEYQSFQRFSFVGSNFARLHQLSILRALALGDSGRAEHLFLKGIELYKILYFLRFPDQTTDFNDLPETIALLGELPQFPTRGLEEARRIMDSVCLPPQQRTDLRKAHARRWLVSTINNQNQVWRQSENWMHWIRVKEIGPDALMLKLMWPKLHQCTIDYASAWEAGDNAAMSRSLKSMRAYGRLANIDTSVTATYMMEIEEKDTWPPADPDLIRLSLALALYHRATGALPATRRELIPRYLSPAFQGDSEESWNMGRVEPYEKVIRFGKNGSVTCKEPARVYIYQRSSHPPTGSTSNWVDIIVSPVHVKAWEPILELFRRADRERGITIKKRLDPKNSSNQTSATALKR